MNNEQVIEKSNLIQIKFNCERNPAQQRTSLCLALSIYLSLSYCQTSDYLSLYIFNTNTHPCSDTHIDTHTQRLTLFVKV